MVTSLLRRVVQSSELSRNPAAVFAAAEDGPVDVTRRDGEDLVLMSASRAAGERQALSIAAELVAASTSQDGRALVDRLRQPFPWLEFLAPEDRERFTREIVDVTRACASVGEYSRLLAAFSAWHSTAEAIAHGYTPDEALEWLDGETVADPREAS